MTLYACSYVLGSTLTKKFITGGGGGGGGVGVAMVTSIVSSHALCSL